MLKLAINRAVTFCLMLLPACQLHGDQWKLADTPLKTRWAAKVTPDKVHPEYPRPQLVRERWRNLNGLWDYAIRSQSEEKPKQFDGQILVPFPVESALSGVKQRVTPEQRLWYRRTFELPGTWTGETILLHFGAVDWDATVWVNGQEVGRHRGGYTPFTFDITEALKPAGEQEIVVAVLDPTDAGTQPRGKQVRDPRSIWYTPSTGIWQTVWLEPVPKTHIERLKITPDFDHSLARIETAIAGETDQVTVEVLVFDADQQVAKVRGKAGESIDPTIPAPKPWSPDTPHLYGLTVKLYHGEKLIDQVESYWGLRKISLAKDSKGILRLALNDKPLFQWGPLDQGFWPEGLYTAPTDEALRYDIEITKRLGFNMIRKHVKVEPARWYYWCDKLGMLAWQDMPSGDQIIGPADPDIQRSEDSARQFEAELQEMIDALHHHPSIVMWVPFNEGWGQFDTARITDWVKKHDPSRLVNSASGWTDRGTGEINDVHNYPGPRLPELEANRAAALGEFGGLGLPLSGNTWQDEKNWGYRSYETTEELTAAYLNLIATLRPLVHKGLTAAVYTQTTDVEGEVNGLLTYDREVLKMDEKKLQRAHKKLFAPAPEYRAISQAAQHEPQHWRYTTETPAEGWQQSDFDAQAWNEGPAGFGSPRAPGGAVRTEWTSPNIWLRREFELENAEFQDVLLLIHHDENAQVYLNGQLWPRCEALPPTTSSSRWGPKLRSSGKDAMCWQSPASKPRESSTSTQVWLKPSKLRLCPSQPPANEFGSRPLATRGKLSNPQWLGRLPVFLRV